MEIPTGGESETGPPETIAGIFIASGIGADGIEASTGTEVNIPEDECANCWLPITCSVEFGTPFSC